MARYPFQEFTHKYCAVYVFLLPGSSPPGVTTAEPPNLGLRMETLDIVVVVLYFLIVLAVGIWVGVHVVCLVLCTTTVFCI